MPLVTPRPTSSKPTSTSTSTSTSCIAIVNKWLKKRGLQVPPNHLFFDPEAPQKPSRPFRNRILKEKPIHCRVIPIDQNGFPIAYQKKTFSYALTSKQ